MEEYDVIVIGLGAIGAATLYQLSKTNQNVLGIDMFHPPHTYGSSGGESCVTRQAMAEGEHYMPLIQRSNEIWVELRELSGKRLYRHCGVLLAGYENSTFYKKTISVAEKYNIKHETFNSEEALDKFEFLKADDPKLSYYYEPDSGYLLPETCIEVQLEQAQNNGAKCEFNVTVSDIYETEGVVKILLQDEQVITAKKVVVCAGPWIKQFVGDSLSKKLRTTLQTLYWFNIDNEDSVDLKDMPVFMCADERYGSGRNFYGFPTVQGGAEGVKFAVHEYEHEASPAEKDALSPTMSAGEVYELISRHIKGAGRTVVQEINCLYTMTPDWNFILDFAPNSKNIILGSACSGHGFKHSAAVGEVLSDLAVEGKTSYDISKFAVNRL